MDYSASAIVPILSVIGIDILLSSDNAVVIAMACRNLPPKQRARGIWIGAAGAVILRVLLVFCAVWLLALPGIHLIAALWLLWIAIGLVKPASEDDEPNVSASDRLWSAVKTVVIADLIMSFDNIAAVAGVAERSGEHQFLVAAVGLVCSIPLCIAGSQIVMRLMDRFPWLVVAGGVLLGWVSGSLASAEQMIPVIPASALAAACAGLVLLCGLIPRWRKA